MNHEVLASEQLRTYAHYLSDNGLDRQLRPGRVLHNVKATSHCREKNKEAAAHTQAVVKGYPAVLFVAQRVFLCPAMPGGRKKNIRAARHCHV